MRETIQAMQEVEETVSKKISNNSQSEKLCLYNLIKQVSEECFRVIREEREYFKGIIWEEKQQDYFQEQMSLVQEKMMANLVDKTNTLLQRGISSIELAQVAAILNTLKQTIGNQLLHMQAAKIF